MKKRIFVSVLAAALCASVVFGAIALPAKARITENRAESYSDIFKLIQKRQAEPKLAGGFIMEDAAAAPETGAVLDYSTTNLQEAGVDGADTVKTDGSYLYALTGEKIYIVKAQAGKLTLTAAIERKNDQERFMELYLCGNRLVVIKDIYEEAEPEDDGVIYDCAYLGGQTTEVELYNIENKQTPALAESFSQDGNYLNSRMVEDCLYLLTTKYVSGDIRQEQPETYIPELGKNGKNGIMPVGDIYVYPGEDGGADNYVVMAGIDVAKGERVSSKAILGYQMDVYCAQENLYLSTPDWSRSRVKFQSGTKLMRFALKEGALSLEAEGRVPGLLNNQFSMSEKGNTLRLVTTVEGDHFIREDDKYSTGEEIATRSNSLYVLNLELQIQGAVERLAPGEQIYSARFIGDMAYFVTFRNVDPLFAVDLSKPDSPRVLSALKIPGFSEYLHPYGKDLLLGIGRDADEKTGETGVVKLSMFNIKNGGNVLEQDKKLTKEWYSQALDNHKAVLVDEKKGLVAFPGEDNYLIYTYDEGKGFSLEKAVKFNYDEEYYGGEIRGLYIGDYLYAVNSGYDSGLAIATVHLKDYALGENLVLE